MLNIISLTANRRKTTGPGKVVKNLMKGLDELGYPYVLNADINATKMLWIHDDVRLLSELKNLKSDVGVLIGPNLFALPRKVHNPTSLEKYPHIMPAHWVVDFWRRFGYTGTLDVWPAGIDSDDFGPSSKEKTDILVYYKQRPQADLDFLVEILEEKNLSYTLLDYGTYDESSFREALSHARYAIWVGCSESQGIAFGEMLSSSVPALVWDIDTLGACAFPGSDFTLPELAYEGVTSAPYFDETCGIRITEKGDLSTAIEKMESSYHSFTPRQYILDHLTLAHQARALLSLYEKYYNLDESEWRSTLLRTTKKSHNNTLIRILFDLYDSRLGRIFRTYIRK